MKLIYFITLGLLLTSCDFNTDKHNDVEKQREFNVVVDELLRFKFSDISIVQAETRPIFKTNPNQIDKSDSLDSITPPPPPPPPGMIIYSKEVFESLVENNFLTSKDANYMYNEIDSTLILKLNQENSWYTLISRKKLSTFFDTNVDPDSGYVLLKKTYGSSDFIKISTPLFNENLTKLILSVDYHCGGLCGQGYFFVMAKENDKWRIVETFGTWES